MKENGTRRVTNDLNHSGDSSNPNSEEVDDETNEEYINSRAKLRILKRMRTDDDRRKENNIKKCRVDVENTRTIKVVEVIMDDAINAAFYQVRNNFFCII